MNLDQVIDYVGNADSEPNSDSINDHADPVASISKPTNNNTESSQSLLQQLISKVHRQQKTIDQLTKRISFILSFLDIDDSPGVSPSTSSFADAVKQIARPIVNAVNDHDSVDAAVYIDNQRRVNRSINFVVAGLPFIDCKTDQSAVVDLCSREFADVIFCKRLGKPITGHFLWSLQQPHKLHGLLRN